MAMNKTAVWFWECYQQGKNTNNQAKPFSAVRCLFTSREYQGLEFIIQNASPWQPSWEGCAFNLILWEWGRQRSSVVSSLSFMVCVLRRDGWRTKYSREDCPKIYSLQRLIEKDCNSTASTMRLYILPHFFLFSEFPCCTISVTLRILAREYRMS